MSNLGVELPEDGVTPEHVGTIRYCIDIYIYIYIYKVQLLVS